MVDTAGQFACVPPVAGSNLTRMFTGIVEETGSVVGIRESSEAIQLSLRAKLTARGLKPGDSLAVNGCCLTVVAVGKGRALKTLRFDLLKETWRRTNLQFVQPGSQVNLERAMRADGRLGGHFVTGHIDGLGRIVRWERAGRDHVLDIRAPAEVLRYVVFKGSIAVDGISLTVAAVRRGGLRLWIIPHTFEVTALRERKIGDAVNLEADLLGKYVKQFVTSRRSA
jgi:riboflavin synthase